MRDGFSPTDAAKIAITRIVRIYPAFSGAVIAVAADGTYGAACNGMAQFPYSVKNEELPDVTVFSVNCSNP